MGVRVFPFYTMTGVLGCWNLIDRWGQAGMRIREYRFETPIPAPSAPDGYGFHPLSRPTGFFPYQTLPI